MKCYNIDSDHIPGCFPTFLFWYLNRKPKSLYILDLQHEEGELYDLDFLNCFGMWFPSLIVYMYLLWVLVFVSLKWWNNQSWWIRTWKLFCWWIMFYRFSSIIFCSFFMKLNLHVHIEMFDYISFVGMFFSCSINLRIKISKVSVYASTNF